MYERLDNLISQDAVRHGNSLSSSSFPSLVVLGPIFYSYEVSLQSKFIHDKTPTMCKFLYFTKETLVSERLSVFLKDKELAHDRARIFKHRIFQILSSPTASPP